MSLLCDVERLEALVLRELPSREARAVRAHAEQCPPCGDALDALQATRAALAGPARRTPERIGHLYPVIAGRVLARRSVRRQLSAMAVTFASLCAVVLVSTSADRGLSAQAMAEACAIQCLEPSVCEPPSRDDEIARLEQHFAACLIATPGQWP